MDFAIGAGVIVAVIAMIVLGIVFTYPRPETRSIKQQVWHATEEIRSTKWGRWF
ncbi:MAG TPA: hypothetical protein VMM78_04050 [Thermomicrobiales bacterium]|nr:hypothetical protein [Thermomicrobiales bacterium]